MSFYNDIKLEYLLFKYITNLLKDNSLYNARVYRMTNNYEKVVNKFNERNCKLLNTNEEYIEILKSSKNTTYKLNYIASCGHEHIVFYNVFKSR